MGVEMVSGVFRKTVLVDHPVKSVHVRKASYVLEHHHILTSFPGPLFPGDTTKPAQRTTRASSVLLLAALLFFSQAHSFIHADPRWELYTGSGCSLPLLYLCFSQGHIGAL